MKRGTVKTSLPRFRLIARLLAPLRTWRSGWPFAEQVDFKYVPWP